MQSECADFYVAKIKAVIFNCMLCAFSQMIALYKDPRGEKVFDKVKNNSIHLSRISSGSNHSVSSDKGHETEVAALRNTVAQLERKLRTYEKSRSEDNGLASNTQNHASVCQQ